MAEKTQHYAEVSGILLLKCQAKGWDINKAIMLFMWLYDMGLLDEDLKDIELKFDGGGIHMFAMLDNTTTESDKILVQSDVAQLIANCVQCAHDFGKSMLSACRNM